MGLETVLIAVFGALSAIFGGVFLRIRVAVKEVADVIAALDDVMTDTEGETVDEKTADLKKLTQEAKEAFEALKKIVKA